MELLKSHHGRERTKGRKEVREGGNLNHTEELTGWKQ